MFLLDIACPSIGQQRDGAQPPLLPNSTHEELKHGPPHGKICRDVHPRHLGVADLPSAKTQTKPLTDWASHSLFHGAGCIQAFPYLQQECLVDVGRGATIYFLAVNWGFPTKPQ